jgi:ligand-binding SRPBCC domain-containing protein
MMSLPCELCLASNHKGDVVVKNAPYRLVHEQVVPRPLNDVFAFFSRAENLETITPDFLHFKILSIGPQPVQTGTLINYSLRVRGLPLHWTSKITEWEPPNRFVDLQVRGPYKLWRHTHRFIAEGNNTRIIDDVVYALPLGPLGRLAHWLMVKRDVEGIFAFREQKIRALFG